MTFEIKPVIAQELVKELMKQINFHSEQIIALIQTEEEEINLQEIVVQNQCIQEVLVSFHDLYLAGKIHRCDRCQNELILARYCKFCHEVHVHA